MIHILKKIGQFILDTVQAIVLALSIFIIIYLFLFQPHQVKGSSMHPNFENGEFLLTNKISYRFEKPKRGEIIVFKAPPSEPCAEIECEYIKRVIGVPGDRVMVSDGKVYVNGQLLNETYLSKDLVTGSGSFLSEGVEKVIPDGYYLPMGDNRPYSSDSRVFGAFSLEDVIAKDTYVFYPLHEINWFKGK